MKLQDIISILNREAANIRQLIQEPSFLGTIVEGLKKDPIDVDLSTESWLNHISDKPGIYFFEADFSLWRHSWKGFIPKFDRLWNHPTIKIGTFPKFFTGKAKKTITPFSQNQTIPFYLGIRKNIQLRVHEHVFDQRNGTTSALKIKSRQADLTGISFSVGHFVIDVPEEHQFLLELIESEIRKTINPIVGKQ